MFIEGSKILLYSIVVSIIINLVLPQILLPFASPEEIKPPNDASSSFIQTKFINMFVHHAQVPITSSIIVALIVLISVLVSIFLSSLF